LADGLNIRRNTLTELQQSSQARLQLIASH
jgi:hypothetical protein